MINGKPSDPCGKAFVEPKFTPPVHSNKITEPLMSKLVCYHICHPVSVAVCRCLFVKEDGGRSVAPVLDHYRVSG